MISLFSRKATYGLEARKSCSKELIRMNSYESSSGKIIIREDNNQTHKLGNVEWHCFVVTSVNNSMQMCPASLNLFGMDVDGSVYWFNKKTNQ